MAMTIKTSEVLMIISLFITAGLSLLVNPSFGEEHSHHGKPDAASIQLNAGKKWKTDAPLRAGMTGIRKALEPRISAIRLGTLKEREYAELSEQLTAQVNSIFRNCHLDPKADEQLHIVLIQIMDGAKAMKAAVGVEERQKGAFKVVGALEQYPRYFEHSGWVELQQK
jgi:hypothetical protein